MDFRMLLVGIAVAVCLTGGWSVPECCAETGSDQTRLAFFCTEFTHEDAGPFWGRFIDMMEAACRDLEVTLDVYYANDSHIYMKNQMAAVLSSDTRKPDGIVVLNYKEMGSEFLQLAENAQIPVVLVNTGFEDHQTTGRPTEKFTYWIAEVLPDDQQAGRSLMAELLQCAPRKAPDGRVHVLALEGQPFHASSRARVAGMRSVIEGRDDVVLKQVANCEWNFELAEEKVVYLVSNRYPHVSVVWAASDEVGLGAVAGLDTHGWTYGEEYVVGGIDWSNAGKEAVRDGRFKATVGGHFMEGVWAVIILYDYLNGVKLRDDERVIRSPMLVLDAENVDEISRYVLDDGCWENKGFERFSRLLNPEQERYPFVGNYVEYMKVDGESGDAEEPAQVDRMRDE